MNKIVDSALELPRSQRAGFIQDKCGSDDNLREEVIRYVESIEKSNTENFLEEPYQLIGNLAEDLTGQKAASVPSLAGKTIENYRILDLIGKGGMGSVFVAERIDDAYQKKVALKLLRRGMDTPENLARFKRERNILANLDHPNITQLMDGGVTKYGLPFLVMDYVKGIPLFEYCDKKKLSICERLELFKTICDAVQHAHKNAVIHRDLKPSNILITDEGKVKVLDFGIAKLNQRSDSEKDEHRSRSGEKILTLRYAAPEQVKGETATTATDTYTLGLLLYEMLAGIHPLDLEGSDIRQMERIISDEMPIALSEKLKRLAESTQQTIAENRQTDPQNLVRKLSGDLDAILLKALRKNPEERYNSVEKILADLQRIEKHLPVSAKGDSLQYRTNKFFRRRKKEIGVASVFLFSIIGFTLFHTSQITQERNIAQREARRADDVAAFLLELFDTKSAGDTLSAAGLLQEGITHLEGLENKPAHASMASVMGQAYLNFGNYEKAESLLKQSVNESKKVYGEESIEYATALFRMGLLHQESYRWDDAVSNFQKSYELHSAILGEDHFKTGNVLTHLGTSLRNTEDLKKAELYTRKAVEVHEKVLEPTDAQLLTTHANLAYVLRERGKTDEAELIYLQVIEKAKDNPSVKEGVLADYYNNLGYLYRVKREYVKAVENYRNALYHLDRSYVKGHPEIIRTRKNLATSLFFQDSLKQTESLFKKNLSEIREKYSENHRRTATSLNTMGLFYLETGDFKKAESYLRKSVDINQNVLGPNHLWTAYSEGLLAASLKFQNQSVTEIESLDKHHIEVYKEHKNELDAINKNQLNRLIRIYEKYTENDSTYFAYQDFLN